MNEIYWLTRIGKLGDMFNLAVIMGIVILVLVLIFIPLIYDFCEGNDLHKKIVFRSIKGFFIGFAFCFLGHIFTPSSEEMLAIYGLGTTIDYIKGNDKVKQLPDKVVDALTRYVDTIVKENETEEK